MRFHPLFGHDTQCGCNKILEFLFLSSFSGSVYLFKEHTSWKFMFPGSTLQDGYLPPSPADWLDCTGVSSSMIKVDKLSLTLPAGGRELQWWERKAKDDALGRRRHYGIYGVYQMSIN